MFCSENFRKIQKCLQLCFGDSFASQASCETPVVSLFRCSYNSLESQSTSCKKYLEKFQNFWVFGIFMTQFGDLFPSGSSSRELIRIRGSLRNLLASQSSRENCGFCITRIKSKTIFKNFLVFPRIMCTLIVLSASPSPKTSIFTHKTSIFFINPSSIFKKRNGFSLIFNVFQVSSPSFLGFFVYVEI